MNDVQNQQMEECRCVSPQDEEEPRRQESAAQAKLNPERDGDLLAPQGSGTTRTVKAHTPIMVVGVDGVCDDNDE